MLKAYTQVTAVLFYSNESFNLVWWYFQGTVNRGSATAISDCLISLEHRLILDLCLIIPYERTVFVMMSTCEPRWNVAVQSSIRLLSWASAHCQCPHGTAVCSRTRLGIGPNHSTQASTAVTSPQHAPLKGLNATEPIGFRTMGELCACTVSTRSKLTPHPLSWLIQLHGLSHFTYGISHIQIIYTESNHCRMVWNRAAM